MFMGTFYVNYLLHYAKIHIKYRLEIGNQFGGEAFVDSFILKKNIWLLGNWLIFLSSFKDENAK